MATPRSAWISTSSSSSSISSSSFRLVSDAGEIVRQRARGAGEPRAELVEPAPSWLGHRPRLWASLSCARRAAIPQAAWRQAPLRAPAGGGADLGDGADLPASSGAGWGCGPAGGGPFGFGVRFGLAEASLGRRSRLGGSSLWQDDPSAAPFCQGPCRAAPAWEAAASRLASARSSPMPNRRLKKPGFLVSLMARPSRSARRRRRPQPRRRSARPRRARPRERPA